MLSETSGDCLDAPGQPTRLPTASSMSMVKHSLSVFIFFLSSAFSTLESSRHILNATAFFPGMSPFSLSVPRRARTERPVTSASQQMREALFFYPWLDSVSVQDGSDAWSKLLIPHHGVGGSP